MIRAFLTAYPWDFVSEDLETCLDRLHGEVGLTGVSVWVAAQPTTQLRVRDVHPRVFRTRGGLFFHPDEQHYAATRCKPVVSSWLKGRDPLKRIGDGCARRAMDLRVIVSGSATGRLARRYPDMACKSAFGDVSHLSLCLANPDVQTYLCGLVGDLSSNHPIVALTMTDFDLAWSEARKPSLTRTPSLGETETALLSMCFCESCQQQATAADVDMAATRRSVQVLLQRSLDSGVAIGQGLDVILADNAPLAAYARWRSEELGRLLGRLTDSSAVDLLLDRRLDPAEAHQHGGLDWGCPAGVITRLSHPDDLSSARCPTARLSELRLPDSFAIGPHAPALVRTLSQAVGLGFSGVVFDHYGLLPDTALTPIKQAVRFARRSAREA